MNTEELLKIAASFARGVDPQTGAPLENQRVELPPKAHSLDPRPAKSASPPKGSTKWSSLSLSKEQQVLLRSFAEASASATPSLDEFLLKKHADFLPSLRAIGAEAGEGWSLVKLQWTVEYWKERALLAEAKLRDNV